MSHWQIKHENSISTGDMFMNGRYSVVKKIGEGGQGKAYVVKDTQLNVEYRTTKINV